MDAVVAKPDTAPTLTRILVNVSQKATPFLDGKHCVFGQVRWLICNCSEYCRLLDSPYACAQMCCASSELISLSVSSR
jgi:hypothetical protein